MPPSRVELICAACLNDKAVRERLGVVRTVAHPRSLVTKCDACGLQKRSVRVTERVPAHAGTVEVSEGHLEGVVGSPVLPRHREAEFMQEMFGPGAEWDHPYPRPGLGGVRSSVPVASAPDSEDMALYVAWLQGDDLAPAQAGEQDDLRDSVPRVFETPYHPLDLWERERVLTSRRLRNTGSVGRDGSRLDDPAPDRVAKAAREDGVDASHGGRGESGAEKVCDELGQVLGADLADEHRSEPALCAGYAPWIAAERVGPSAGLLGLGAVPDVECCGDCFLFETPQARECALGCWSAMTGGLVHLPAADARADHPLATALVPMLPAVPALLAEASHRAESMGSRSPESSAHAGSHGPSTSSGSERTAHPGDFPCSRPRSHRGVASEGATSLPGGTA